MKKTLALILAACMSLSLVACGGGNSSTPNNGSQAGTSQPASSQQIGRAHV